MLVQGEGPASASRAAPIVSGALPASAAKASRAVSSAHKWSSTAARKPGSAAAAREKGRLTAREARAAALARDASEPPSVLRERVTSKGGTTYAALTSMQQAQVPQAFIAAMHAACRRATELGDEFGRA